MKISVGADHGGWKIKDAVAEALRKAGHTVTDHGTNSDESVDYPDFAEAVSRDVGEGRAERGVIVCTTGIGVCITANKIHGVRAALVPNADDARLSREHNNANVICLSGMHHTADTAREYTEIFMNTAFLEDHERHARRVSKINALDNEGHK